MKAQELFDELGARLKFKIELSDQGTCAINFDNHIVEFEAKENALYFIANLTPLTDAQASLESLLRASFLGKETGHASIGIENNDLMLFRIITLPMDYTYFESSLDLFVKAVRYWKDFLHLARLDKSEVPAQEDEQTDLIYMKV